MRTASLKPAIRVQVPEGATAHATPTRPHEVDFDRLRPTLRQLAFQPGFVACAALCLATLVYIDLAYFGLVSIPPRIGIILLGATVLLPWLILLATGRWIPDGSWIDRAGGLTGLFWMAAACWMVWAVL